MSLIKHIPNTITSMNLLSGTMGVICALRGEVGLAFLFMLAGSVFDFCDGLAARLLKAYSPIGKELDSLCDMVSFGVLPGLMLVETMLLGGSPFLRACLPVFLVVMAALRLAKFNVDERQGSNFIGLPSPAAALLSGALCTFIFFSPESLPARWAATPWFLPAVAVVLGLLMVSEIPMFGMKVAKGHKLLDTKRIVFLALSVAAIVLTFAAGFHWSLAVLLPFSIYLLENLILWLWPKRESR